MKSPRFRAGGFLCPFVRGGLVRVPAARPMRRGYCAHSYTAGFRLLSPSVPPPAALTACWKRGRSVREISPLWKEFFLKFTSGNQDKPVQSSEMEPGVSARRGAASARCFHIFPSISRRTRVFSFSDCFTGEIILLFIFKNEFFSQNKSISTAILINLSC